ncbi:hypothetical protein V4F39_13820 [Aquincola sp. MAHUQ-54]|uniref:Uncharacterized protein n=1 Tax=Aquincola agrisoli TaxID=3119538 RepID=A0AAW9QK52_9BURK
MNLISQALAGVVLAACIALLLRMLIGERRRARLDAALRRGWAALRRRSLARPAAKPLHPQDAARMAEEAIRRAARRGRWDGNVYKPDAFRPPKDGQGRDRRKPH